MPTGKAHVKIDDDGNELPCRCTEGDDHGIDDSRYALSNEDANDIWLSSGKDEDYDFRS